MKLECEYAPAGDQSAAISSLIQGIQDGLFAQTLLGVTGSGKTFTMAHVIAALGRPTLIMAPNKTLAAQLYGEMRQYFPKQRVEYFVSYYDYYQPEAYVPASDTYIEKDASVNAHIEQMRLSATKALMESREVIIVATVSAIYGLGDPKSYMTMLLHVTQNERIEQRAILRRLAELQYTRNPAVLERGTFQVKGEVIDIFPAESSEDAVRLQMFDDEVEAIWLFDPLTGQLKEQRARITIYPKTHYVTPREVILKAMDAIKEELRERLELLHREERLVEAQRLSERTQLDLEMLSELGYCNGIENYSRYLSGRGPGEPPPTLMDYFPSDGLVIFDESHVGIPQIRGMYFGDRSRKENLVNYGFRLPSALDNRPLRFEEFWELVGQCIFVSATPGPYEAEHAEAIIEQVVRPTGLLDPPVTVRPVGNQVDDLLSEIKKAIAAKERVLVTTLTKRFSEDLTRYYTEQGFAVRYLHSDIDTVERMMLIQGLRAGEFDVLIGINLLREGLDMPEVALVAVLDADKEGFLRSERSLIQTMGRAARNINGRVILYADSITGSMEKAMSETQRRREKQMEHNEKHGITPKGIVKPIVDVMQAGNIAKGLPLERANTVSDPKAAAQEIAQLEKRMLAHAKNLEFEQAGQLRDLIKKLRTQSFGA